MNQRIKHVVFWQNIASHLQVPYIQRIKDKRPDWEVHLVVDSCMNARRANLGWKNPILDLPRNKVLCYEKPDRQVVESLLSLPNALHLLGGIKGNSNAREVIAAKKHQQFMLGLISEDVDLRGMRVITRRMASWGIERPLVSKFDIVFCFGRSAVDWYSSCGFLESKLVPFAYSVEATKLALRKERIGLAGKSSRPLKVIYVGALTIRKDVQLLLSAISCFRNSQFDNVALTVAGGRPQSSGTRAAGIAVRD